jgi:hypothetical protein
VENLNVSSHHVEIDKIIELRANCKTQKTVTPAKAGVQKVLKILDSRLRGNDKPGLLQLALMKKHIFYLV